MAKGCEAINVILYGTWGVRENIEKGRSLKKFLRKKSESKI